MKRRFGCAMTAALLLVIFPQEALTAAQRAMKLWVESVAPALFPFFVLLPVLTGAEAAAFYQRALGRIMPALFRLPGCAASVVAVGLLAGSPAGAQATARLVARGQLAPAQGMRLACMVSGVGPAFLISAVGQGMLKDARCGLALYLAQTAALFVCGAGAARLPVLPTRHAATRIQQTEQAAEATIAGAVRTILGVGGWMVLFSVAQGCVARLWPAGAQITGLFAEVASGMRAAVSMPLAADEKMLLLGGIAGFGGVCVAAQNLAALTGFARMAYFVAFKLLAGLLCAGFSWGIGRILPHLPRTLPPFSLAVYLALGAALLPIGYCFFRLKRRRKLCIIQKEARRAGRAIRES